MGFDVFIEAHSYFYHLLYEKRHDKQLFDVKRLPVIQ